MIYIDSTTIVFLVALAGIAGMIELKYLEIKKGRKLFLSRLGESTDHIVHAAYDHVRIFLSHFNRRTCIEAAQYIAVHVLSWLRSIYIRLYHLAHRNPHSKKVIDMVRGRGEANSNGGSSFYIKQMVQEHEASRVVENVLPTVAKEEQK